MKPTKTRPPRRRGKLIPFPPPEEELEDIVADVARLVAKQGRLMAAMAHLVDEQMHTTAKLLCEMQAAAAALTPEKQP